MREAPGAALPRSAFGVGLLGAPLGAPGTRSAAPARGLFLSPRGSFALLDLPCVMRFLSLGAPSPAFHSCFAFLPAQRHGGAIKRSLFPLRVKLSVPAFRGSGLIPPKTPRKTFSVDAVAGPSVPLDVRPGGARSLGQGVSFPSGFGGFPPFPDFILDGFRSWNAGKPTLLLWGLVWWVFCFFFSQKHQAGPCCGAPVGRGGCWGWAGNFTTLSGIETSPPACWLSPLSAASDRLSNNNNHHHHHQEYINNNTR